MRTTATCALLVLLTAGCGSAAPTPSTGGGASSTGTTTATSPESSSAVMTSAPVPTVTPTATVAAAAARSAADRARGATLTVGDLPGGGWKPNASRDFSRTDVPRSSRPECEPPNVLRSGPKPAGRAETSFAVLTTDYEYVNEIALVYPDASTAGSSVAHILKLARSCRTWKNGGVAGEEYGFTIRQTVEKASWSPRTSLLRWAMTTFPDVPPSRSAVAVRQEGPVVVLVQAVFPLTSDRGVVGLREMTDLAQKLARRGAS